MSKIRILGEEVIPKIAAGEVVDRPASIVKELVENALDAGAERISVSIEDSEAGIARIVVVDDGEGMDREDLARCFLPHSTSKIVNAEDLHFIKTLGFRGEALGSICAVSTVVIKSRQAEADKGWQLEIEGGTTGNSIPVGMATGTLVEVRDLFYNVPARKKFLKSTRTEVQRILDVMTGFILGNPEVDFRVSRNGKSPLDTGVVPDPLGRAVAVFGADFCANLFGIQTASEYLKLEGYLSKPQLAARSKNKQYLFVNKRFVTNPTISAAVRDAYNNYLEATAQPPFILFLQLQPDLVDVNIHPRKDEVRFWDEAAIYDFVYNSVKSQLGTEDLTFTKGYDTDVFGLDRKAAPYIFMRLKDSVQKWDVQPHAEELSADILQINNTYLVYADGKNLMVVDQHAAHESILYEQYLREFKNQKEQCAPFILEMPILVELTKMQQLVVEENEETINKLGFQLEKFGETAYKVTGIPSLFKDHDIKGLVLEFISDLEQHSKIRDVDEKSKATIEFLACRGAVKAGDFLSPEERKNLIEKLNATTGLYTCPHGRPVKIRISQAELHKMFKRV